MAADNSELNRFQVFNTRDIKYLVLATELLASTDNPMYSAEINHARLTAGNLVRRAERDCIEPDDPTMERHIPLLITPICSYCYTIDSVNWKQD